MGLTNDGVMLGTPEYMSPEAVLNASAVDHHADLWSLAVVAYVSITGELPFVGSDVGELCISLLEAEYDPPSTLRPEVPPEIDAWFAKALSKDVDDRFQTARGDGAGALVSALPNASMPGDPLQSSGGWPEARGSSPGMAGLADGERGMRGDSFSGAAADAGSMKNGLSPTTIGGAVAAALLAIIVAILFFGGPSEGETTPKPAAAGPSATTAVATEAPPTPPIESAPAPSAETKPSGRPVTSSTPAVSVPAPKPIYKGIPRPRPTKVFPKPKDPGF